MKSLSQSLRSGWNLLAGLLALAVLLPAGRVSAAEPAKKLLIVNVTKGFRHSSIPLGEQILTEIGQKSGVYTCDYVRNDQDMAVKMTPAALKNYDGVVFESTTGVLPLPDKSGFLDWIKNGGAFIGIHAATDTFHSPNSPSTNVDAYIDMIGGEFLKHDEQVKVECLNLDPKHPATVMLGKSLVIFDEIYQMKNYSRDRVHVLLELDKHPNPKDASPGHYPISWCKKYGLGNVFYTSLGHREDVWQNPLYQQHLLGGIKWALGLEPGDASPGNTSATP